MAVPKAVSFHSHPRGTAWTGAAILAGSVLLAMVLLTTVLPHP